MIWPQEAVRSVTASAPGKSRIIGDMQDAVHGARDGVCFDRVICGQSIRRRRAFLPIRTPVRLSPSRPKWQGSITSSRESGIVQQGLRAGGVPAHRMLDQVRCSVRIGLTVTMISGRPGKMVLEQNDMRGYRQQEQVIPMPSGTSSMRADLVRG